MATGGKSLNANATAQSACTKDVNDPSPIVTDASDISNNSLGYESSVADSSVQACKEAPKGSELEDNTENNANKSNVNIEPKTSEEEIKPEQNGDTTEVNDNKSNVKIEPKTSEEEIKQEIRGTESKKTKSEKKNESANDQSDEESATDDSDIDANSVDGSTEGNDQSDNNSTKRKKGGNRANKSKEYKQKKRLRKENRHLEKFGNAQESSKKDILETKNTAIKNNNSCPPAVGPSENACNKPSDDQRFVFGRVEKQQDKNKGKQSNASGDHLFSIVKKPTMDSKV